MAAQIGGAVLASTLPYVVASGNGHFDAVAAGFASNGYGARLPDG